ncbi:hypothetical protein PHMEG_00026527 [Phytophthora megakarya]|uniref:Uncharacterized protein n=1 Tax=Phytophthora megakarya TaxID=4795 RepID=A0A225V9C7_9STRA|nr:hypothetical protein PHMEG_00026527 [Phytophthora megakarya]
MKTRRPENEREWALSRRGGRRHGGWRNQILGLAGIWENTSGGKSVGPARWPKIE